MNKREKIDPSRDKRAKRVKTITPVDTYKVEEDEADTECFMLYSETCDKMFTCLQGIKKLHLSSSADEAAVKQLRQNYVMLTLKLKKLNRWDKHLLMKSKNEVHERRQNTDAVNLQLQNLLYELTHLQGEENKCLQFKSLDEDVVLVPVEDFYRDAPEDISKPDITKVNDHELRLARLFWEIEQRKRLSETLKEKEILRQEMIQSIKKIEEKLSNIEPTVNAVIEAIEPFESKIGFPLLAQKVKHKKAKYLPDPLYVLYIQAAAFSEHFGTNHMQIRIEGNSGDIKGLQLKDVELSEDSGDSDKEEAVVSSHRHLKKEDAKKDILLKHPMSVLITIDKESRIDLEFTYLIHLNIVSVKVQGLTPEPMSTDLIGDLLLFDTFLDNLFPDDLGRQTPNLSGIYLFHNKLDLESATFKNETTGLPYVWAQKISGLHFVSANKLNAMEQEIPSCMEDVVHAICSRLRARTQLYYQIQTIEQKMNLPEAFLSQYPKNISSQVKKWSPVPWKDIKDHPKIEELKDLNIIHEYCLLYRADIQRASATLSVLVVIPPEYPHKTPICLLTLHWSDCNSAVRDCALKELEKEVNVDFITHLKEEFKATLLLCQMFHLCVCFDVYIETDGHTEPLDGPPEFLHEKVFIQNKRGPSRSRPYHCVSPQGIFTFR